MPRSQTSPSESLAQRLTLALCAALIAAFGYGLYRYTAGLEVWTFEGQRRLALQAGRLHAAAVPLLEEATTSIRLWPSAGGAPTAAYLVDFVYTRCPSVCSVLGNEYQQMQAKLAAERRASNDARAVRLVSISFDQQHDDAASLRAYAREHAIDPSLWTLAIPASAADTRRLMRSLDVVAIPDGLGGYVHNGAIHLIDASGQLRGLYEFDQWPEALAAAKRLAAAEAR